MKKVTAIIGTQTKRATCTAVRIFEECLKTYGEIYFEYVFLHEYQLEYCRGCKLCFDQGEEYCPCRDDRDQLIEKMEQSDGVIFAVPNYAFQVPAVMKNLLDRTAYLLHRPRFFGKACTAIVPQGLLGGADIVKYLNTMGRSMGFHPAKGCALRTLEPMTEKAQHTNRQKIRKAAVRFYRELMRSAPPAPSLFRLMLFRMNRAGIHAGLDDAYNF